MDIAQADLEEDSQGDKLRPDISFHRYRPVDVKVIGMTTALCGLCNSGTLCKMVEMDQNEVQRAFIKHLYNTSCRANMNAAKLDQTKADGENVTQAQSKRFAEECIA